MVPRVPLEQAPDGQALQELATGGQLLVARFSTGTAPGPALLEGAVARAVDIIIDWVVMER